VRTEIRNFRQDGSNILCIDLDGLAEEDLNKVKEYAAMLRKFKKV